MSISTSQKDYLVALSILAVALLVFWFSPVHQITDSNYSMLLSESLIKHRSFALDNYKIPRFSPRYHDNTYKNGEMYQLELVGPHLYYYFPPGSSVLSLPYVAVMNAAGISAANSDGTYSPDGEGMIETTLAAILMAALTAIFYWMARLVLPINWSAVLALAGAFATQVWSTASRGLWSDTWGILLLGIVVWMLLRQEAKRRQWNPILLATLLAWSYFVRPTNVISIAAITTWVFLFYRSTFVKYTVTGALWFAGFVSYSWYNFHQVLPKYFLVNRLSFGSFAAAFAGNLISASRGLLIFVPVLIFIGYLLVRNRARIPLKRLTILSLAIIAAHLIVIAGFVPWNGGFCYGPRYTTSIIPWFVLLAIVAIKSMLENRGAVSAKRVTPWRTQVAAGALLLTISVLMNARGALSQETWAWNNWPVSVDKVPGRIWDWRQPQFLAGLIHPPRPQKFPVLAGKINFASPEADKYLWYGWSWPEPQIRWSDGNEAAVVFTLDKISDSILRIKMGPFLVRGILDQQKVDLSLNGKRIQEIILKDDEAKIVAVFCSREILSRENVLTFEFLDAVRPKSLKVSDDLRKLAVRVEWLELETQP